MSASAVRAPGSSARLHRLIDRHAATGFFTAGILETTVAPLPVEAAAFPAMVQRPRAALAITMALIAGSLIGAALFYAVGALAFGPVATPVLGWLGLPTDPAALRAEIPEDALYWSIFLIAATPVPIQLATLGAGLLGANLPLFLFAIAASRALRFGVLAGLALTLGPRLRLIGMRWVILAMGLAVTAWAVPKLI